MLNGIAHLRVEPRLDLAGPVMISVEGQGQGDWLGKCRQRNEEAHDSGSHSTALCCWRFLYHYAICSLQDLDPSLLLFCRAEASGSYRPSVRMVNNSNKAGPCMLVWWLELYTEKIQLRAVEFTEEAKTGASYMKLEFKDTEDGNGNKLVAETVKEPAEDTFTETDINVDVLKEVYICSINLEF